MTPHTSSPTVTCPVCRRVVPRQHGCQTTCRTGDCADQHHRALQRHWQRARHLERTGLVRAYADVGHWERPLPASGLPPRPDDAPTVRVLADGTVVDVVWDGCLCRYGERGGLLPPRDSASDPLTPLAPGWFGTAPRGAQETDAQKRARLVRATRRRRLVGQAVGRSPRVGV